MKFALSVILAILLVSATAFNSSPDTKYDWDEHSDGEDLAISLSNEPAIIFVVFFYKAVEGNDELSTANDSLRNTIKNDLSSHDEVVYTEVNMSDDNENLETYARLAQNDMGIDVALLEEGPLVAVMNRGQGSWIHGQGKPVAENDNWGAGKDSFNEVLDSIEIFIEESKDRKQGGTGFVSGSPSAKRSGEINVGTSSS